MRVNITALVYLFFVLFFISMTSVYAAWSGTRYLPGTTLNPECAPTDVNCSVSPPLNIAENTVEDGLVVNSSGAVEIADAGITFSKWASNSCGNGQIPKYNTVVGAWECANDSGGSAYTAGSGLDLSGAVFSLDLASNNTWTGTQEFSNGFTVGGNTYSNLAGTGLTFSSGVLSNSLGATIASSEIENGTIISEDLADGTLTFSKIGQNSCANNEIIKWNGSNWVCAADGGNTYTAGTGLSLSTLEFALDINGLNTVSATAMDDYLPIYDTSGSAVGKVSRNDFLAPVLGALNYQGTWDASSTAEPTTCDSNNKGHYYVVSTAGNGYGENDWSVCNGSSWDKLTSTSAVASVFGRTGSVTASTSDYDADQIDNTAAGNITATNVQAALNELDTEKMGTTLNNGYVWVGNSSSIATAVALSGDVDLINDGTVSINNNAVALGDDTTGNYIATLADSGQSIFTITNSGVENAAVTISLADDVLDFSKMKDSLSLDAATSIALGSNNFTFDLSGSGITQMTRSSAGQWLGLSDGTDSFGVYNADGSPESVLAANVGSLAVDTTNGKLYIKTSDTLNTGWSELAAATTGVTSLNSLTGQVQTFATGSTGSDFNIDSSGSTHTFNIPDASVSNRGLITTGSQTIAGDKTFNNALAAPTTTNTINGLVINSGAISGVTSVTGGSSLALSGGSGNITFADHFIPDTNNTYDIGSSSVAVKDIYLAGELNIGGSGLTNSSGTLTWAGGGITASTGTSTFNTAGITTLNATTANITTLNLNDTLNVPGDFSVNTNKFNVTANSGNTTIAGTLGVTGATTLSSTTVNGGLVLKPALLPVSPVAGQIAINSTDNSLNWYNGTDWSTAAGTAATNTWTALQTFNNGIALGSGTSFDANSNKIINLSSPTSANDAANKSYVDALASGISWRSPINDLSATAAPGLPSTGDRYLLQAGASGFGSCTVGQIAEWNGSAWLCENPSSGWTVYAITPATNYNFNGADWVSLGSTVNHDTLVGLQGGQSNEYYHLTAADYGNLTDANAQLAALQTDGSPSFAGLSVSGAIAGPTSTNTINGAVINSGALSSLTGIAMASGNFSQTGTGTFSTGTGTVSLNGDTVITSGKNFYLADNTSQLRMYDSGGSNYVGFVAPASVTSSQIWSLPTADGVTGQVIQTNGSGALSWTTIGAPALNDNQASAYQLLEGANNYFNVATTDAAETIIFGNATTNPKYAFLGTGRLGVGTDSPLGKLHVLDGNSLGLSSVASDLDDLVIENGSGAVGMSLVSPNTSTGYIAFGDTQDSYIGGINYSHSSNAMTFFVNNADKMIINSSGNMGLGTTSPAGKLHVLNGTSLGANLNGGADDLIVENSSSTAGLTILGPNTQSSIIGFGDSDNGYIGGIYYSHSADLLGINVNNANRMAINSSGNMGLGTTSPAGRMHVLTGTSLGIAPVTGADELVLENGSGSSGLNILADSNSWAAIYFGDDSESGVGGIYYNNSNDSLTFDTNSEARMKIDSSGNMGLGTTAPAGKLHVLTGTSLGIGPDAASDDLVIENDGTDVGITILSNQGIGSISFADPGDNDVGEIFYNHGSDLMAFKTSGSTKMVINSLGKMGLGTISPTGKMHILNGTSLGASVSNDRDELVLENGSGVAGMTFLSPNNYQGAIAFGDPEDSDVGGIVYSHASNLMTFIVNNDNRMVIDSSGKMGLGTTSPEGKLHLLTGSSLGVTPNSSGDDLVIEAGTGTNGISLLSAASSTNYIMFGDANDSYVGGIYYKHTDDTLNFNSNNSLRMTLTSDGNLGIGNTNPGSYRLYVAGSAYSSTSFIDGSDARWKKDIVGLEGSLDKVLQLQGVNYNWKTDEYPDQNFGDNLQIGLIAQDVEAVIPELVETNDDGYKGIAYGKLGAVLVEAIKEQHGLVLNNTDAITNVSTILDTDLFVSATDLEVATNSLAQLTTRTAALEETLNDLPTLDTLTVQSLTADGSLIFSSDVQFQGPVIFKQLAEFIDQVIFGNDVEFSGRVTFNQDSAGQAKIKAGQNQVEVVFSTPYVNEPIINVTPRGIYKQMDYAVVDISNQGFTIQIDPTQAADVDFNWSATAVNQIQLQESATSLSENPVDVPVSSSSTTTQPEVVSDDNSASSSAEIQE